MNTDVVTVIKKLRMLQQRTGIIHSIGAHIRYGTKTTVYQFGQSFYQQHFHSLLEFEEKTALHDQIAALLGKQYDESDEHTRRLIAPYLAAHHAESGNETAARSMLVVAAQAAGEIGSTIAHEAYHRFNELAVQTTETTEQTREFISTFNTIEGIATPEIVTESKNDTAEIHIDTASIQKEIITLYHEKKYTEAAILAENTIERIAQSHNDMPKFLVLAAKSRIEMDDISTAREHCRACLELLESAPNAEISCIALNTLAVISILTRDTVLGWNYLRQAAEIATTVSNEYRLLTITNIALLMQKSRPQDAARYKKAAKALSKSLHFSRFALEAFG
jgi:hypothetical protein